MWLLVLVLSWFALVIPGSTGVGVNWGTQASHPLDADIVVRMLRENGFQKVKLFDANPAAMKALGNSGIGVMVGIPNDMLGILANNLDAAEKWVSKNVSFYVSNHGVNIRYVAVGNEPLLQSNNGSYLQTIYPALQNIQGSLIKAGLSNQVKLTVPLNADVYQTSTGVPSGGDFRNDIHDLMLTITKFLNDNDGAFTTNIYPFISLYSDPNFPADYAFFDGSSNGLKDGGTTYNNMLDANHDTLVWALRKNGYENLPIIIGEIGWPTDGDRNANLAYAQRFSQGLIKHIVNGNGTPMRPGPIDAYIFSLIDEDEKSILPGNFERHWGIFFYDGSPKYELNLSINPNLTTLVPAKGVKYLKKKWCVLKQGVSLDDPNIADSVSYACANADCTSLGFGSSCSDLDTRGNISYAFNNYFQKFDQYNRACEFPNLSVITDRDPSTGNCRFNIMIQTSSGLGKKGFGMVRIGLILAATLCSLKFM